MVLVYSMLRGHPALAACATVTSTYSWFTTPLVFSRRMLYLQSTARIQLSLQKARRGGQRPSWPTHFHPATRSKLSNKQTLRFRPYRYAFLHLVRTNSVRDLATMTSAYPKFAQFGITTILPLDAPLRKVVSDWETTHLPPKGLADRAAWNSSMVEFEQSAACAGFLVPNCKRKPSALGQWIS